jgi:hypothetical protein
VQAQGAGVQGVNHQAGELGVAQVLVEAMLSHAGRPSERQLQHRA